MTTQDIRKVLQDDPVIAAVLLARGGWLHAAEVHMREVGDDLWSIKLGRSGDEWYCVYTASETILGVSVRENQA